MVEDVEMTVGEVLVLVFLVVEDVEMAAGAVLVLEVLLELDEVEITTCLVELDEVEIRPGVIEDFVVGEVELATSELLVLELFTGVRLVLDDEDEPATGVMLVLEP